MLACHARRPKGDLRLSQRLPCTGLDPFPTRMTTDRANLASRALARFGVLWGCPELAAATAVRFSPRLRRSVAQAWPARSLITISSTVPPDPELLDEVICHEFAHLVAHRRIGLNEPPHGPTWRALVREGGHAPALSLDGSRLASSESDSTTRVRVGPGPAVQVGQRFRHQCPVCDFSRIAARRVTAWRCRDCLASGLDGLLIIHRIGLPS